MQIVEWIVINYILGVLLIACAGLWQMYIMLSESYTLNCYANTDKMKWIAISLFFSFSISVYLFCPNTRKKGIAFFIMAIAGIIFYGTAMYLEKQIPK